MTWPEGVGLFTSSSLCPRSFEQIQVSGWTRPFPADEGLWRSELEAAPPGVNHCQPPKPRPRGLTSRGRTQGGAWSFHLLL